MLNKPEAYFYAGKDAGRAMRRGDAAAYRQRRFWYTRALSLENLSGRRVAETEWARGYAEGASHATR